MRYDDAHKQGERCGIWWVFRVAPRSWRTFKVLRTRANPELPGKMRQAIAPVFNRIWPSGPENNG